MTCKRRRLGTSQIEVVPLAMGGNVFGWTVDEKRSFRILDAFVDFGLNLIDTANIYSKWVSGNQGGESESIIGKWLKKSGHRDKIVLATKVGMEEVDGSKGLKRNYIHKSVDESLKRLQTDYIDLYQSHENDPDTPLEETLSAYETLIQQGKVRAIGASNYDAKRLAEALSVSRSMQYPSYVSLQPYYNLYDRAGFEETLEPLCLANGLGVLSYFSLAKGFLTGKYRSVEDLEKSPRGQGIARYLDKRGFRILQSLDEIAAIHNVKLAVIALAWLIHRRSVTAPIASVTSVEQLTELLPALTIPLTKEDIAKLDAASS
jgi:aryl-alcohol dehydrogenase-like predicted oxidoreductase